MTRLLVPIRKPEPTDDCVRPLLSSERTCRMSFLAEEYSCWAALEGGGCGGRDSAGGTGGGSGWRRGCQHDGRLDGGRSGQRAGAERGQGEDTCKPVQFHAIPW